MSAKNENVLGSTPQRSAIALLLIDVINDLNFEQGQQILPYAEKMAQRIAVLKAHARENEIPVIYVNDNFGRWRSDFQAQVAHCLEPGSRGRNIAEALRPDDQDYFVLKPKHSGFYSTTLGVLLENIACKSLVLTGLAANICVLFTANDAYMRDFKLFVPSDCVAANTPEACEYALGEMRDLLKADIRCSDSLIASNALTQQKKPTKPTS